MKLVFGQLFLVLMVVAGCGEKAGQGNLVAIESDKPPVANIDGTVIAPPTPEIVDPVVTPSTDTKTAVIDFGVKYQRGKVIDYALVNTIEVLMSGQNKGETISRETFLNASQRVEVGETKGGGAKVSITTSKVTSGFLKKTPEVEEADAFLKQTALSIEGSLLRGDFDSKGKGSNLELIGNGVGLNPMGPQVGSQEVMVGFMGVLLPGKPIKIGDKWSAKFDFSQSASDLFGAAGAKTEKSEIIITYKLLDYDISKNFARVSIQSKGAPVIKVPTDGAMVLVNIKVDSIGEALIRLDDGWLQEMRLETTVVTEGFVASKQIVKTITKRLN